MKRWSRLIALAFVHGPKLTAAFIEAEITRITSRFRQRKFSISKSSRQIFTLIIICKKLNAYIPSKTTLYVKSPKQGKN